MVIIGDTILQGGATHIPLSGLTAYHLLEGSLALASTTPTSGFSTTLYTGNGSTQSINTGVDMATQWGSDATEVYGGLVWIKSRSGVQNHRLLDSARGANVLFSNTTAAQAPVSGLFSQTNTGFSINDTHADWNGATATYASWNFQTTHRITGTTNHGKTYTCHYNPYTGFTIVKYEGSGIAGHEIPHHLGRDIDISTIKNLSATSDWFTPLFGLNNYLYLNATNAGGGTHTHTSDDNVITLSNTGYDISGNSYILYGWANSYFDESNKLIGNYEVGVYQGTGASGNKITTRGKPAWVMIKRLDSIGDWVILDNKRDDFNDPLFPNLPNVEDNLSQYFDASKDGFVINATYANANALGGQYLYMVVYDTNSNGGGSYYPRATDTSNLQVQNATIPFANGIDVNGVKNTILSKNETITGVTYTEGKNYVYCDKNGSYGVKAYEPRYLSSELVRRFAGEQPDYYDIEKNKWFNTNSGSELVTNGTFTDGTTTGWTATAGTTISNVSNTLRISTARANVGQVYTNINFIPGNKYSLKLNASQLNTNMYIYAWIADDANAEVYRLFSGATSVDSLFKLTAQENWKKLVLYLGGGASGDGLYSVDNISVFEADIVPTTEIPESRNYMNHIVYADNDGSPLYVEELPKVEYKDIIKANEYRGKNACTAWVNFDGTTTPPTIIDSFNVSKVIRTSTGNFDIYFENEMDNANYSATGIADTLSGGDYGITLYYRYKNHIGIVIKNATAATDKAASVQVFGGKN